MATAKNTTQQARAKSAPKRAAVPSVDELDAAFPEPKPGAAPSRLNEATDYLLSAVDELHDIRSLIGAAQMAARDIDDREAALNMTTLLEVIFERLNATAEKVDAARPNTEAAQ